MPRMAGRTSAGYGMAARGGWASASGRATHIYDLPTATNARTIAPLGDGHKVLMATAVPERQAGDAEPELAPYRHRDQRAKVWGQSGEPPRA